MDDRPMGVRLADMREDASIEYVLDGNAIGGLLASIFGADVTASPGQCAHCHTVHMVGAMRVYAHGPGVVVRCPSCTQVVMRVVETPAGTMVDMRGVAALRFDRQPS
jgi:predicted Zn finger-like uncharacterized protein